MFALLTTAIIPYIFYWGLHRTKVRYPQICTFTEPLYHEVGHIYV